MTQYGFFIDLSRCIGCNACLIACKQWHDIPPGPVKWMRVFQWEKGAFPDIELHVLPIPCLHCEKPVCAQACPNKAIIKEKKFGAVLVDAEKCTGERACFKACPYGVPQFRSDARDERMSKCNMCIDRLKKGDQPICVLSCSMRALEFGPMDELKKKYGESMQLEYLPENSLTRPSAILKPVDCKKQIVRWDSKKALALWQKRHPDSGEPLPDLFANAADVTRDSSDIMGRTELKLKPKNVEELMFYTTDDE
jgi:anaerobic dimethyl sulfoxide reductase subunit B